MVIVHTWKPEETKMPNVKWTLEKCIASAAIYETRRAWQLGDKIVYSAARRNSWLKKCCAHMRVSRNKWTLEKCKVSAAIYETRNA